MKPSDNISLDFKMLVLQLRKEGTRGYANNSKVRIKAARKIMKTCITVERKENLIA